MSVWQLERDILTYPFWATGPWFPRARLFIAVLSAFFHIGWSCALFVSMHLTLKSSATVSLEVLWGLPLPLSISTWVHLFICLSLLSTCPDHLRWFNHSFDSKGARFNHLYIVDRFTLSSAYIFQTWPFSAEQQNSTVFPVIIICATFFTFL